MATIKKVKKIKRINYFNCSLVVFLISISLFVASNLFLRSYQTTLSFKTQNTIALVNRLGAENEALEVEIARLSNYDRIIALAKEEGLTLVQGNVVSIKDGE
jgi:cell division protein FtsL